MAYEKTIKGHKYLYESYRENGKVKKRYLGRVPDENLNLTKNLNDWVIDAIFWYLVILSTILGVGVIFGALYSFGVLG